MPFRSISFIYVIISILIGCNSASKPVQQKKHNLIIEQKRPADLSTITSTDTKCYGTYKGVEFNSEMEKSDVAHQFSNSMSKAVGDQLKKLCREGKYSKVDFEHIVMITKGMNDGNNYVEYTLEIPFIRVDTKCEATTAFDHSGGWNHYPAIRERKKVLLDEARTTSANKKIEISDLKTTQEGLQEFWIQWKHKDFQGECDF